MHVIRTNNGQCLHKEIMHLSSCSSITVSSNLIQVHNFALLYDLKNINTVWKNKLYEKNKYKLSTYDVYNAN